MKILSQMTWEQLIIISEDIFKHIIINNRVNNCLLSNGSLKQRLPSQLQAHISPAYCLSLDNAKLHNLHRLIII